MKMEVYLNHFRSHFCIRTAEAFPNTTDVHNTDGPLTPAAGGAARPTLQVNPVSEPSGH